jgi:hypothetical protein
MKRSSARRARRWVVQELGRSLCQLPDIIAWTEEACGESDKKLYLQRLTAVWGSRRTNTS